MSDSLHRASRPLPTRTGAGIAPLLLKRHTERMDTPNNLATCAAVSSLMASSVGEGTGGILGRLTPHPLRTSPGIASRHVEAPPL